MKVAPERTRPGGRAPRLDSVPDLSIVVLAWDQLDFTERCVASIRAGTSGVDYELIIVDNGSAPEAVARAEQLADRAVLNGENLGFARGMNAGLATAEGKYIAFANNDTVLPPGWAVSLLAVFDSHPRAGIVAPAVTAAGNPITVRKQPGTRVIALPPFTELPSGVVYVMRTEVIRQLGGWYTGYPIAMAEDLDLCFSVWTNDLDFVLDERVLVDHVSQGTMAEKLDRPWELMRSNLERFLDRWDSGGADPTRLESCPPDVFARNRQSAAAAATWMRRYFEARDRVGRLERQRRSTPEPVSRSSRLVSRVRRRISRVVRR